MVNKSLEIVVLPPHRSIIVAPSEVDSHLVREVERALRLVELDVCLGRVVNDEMEAGGAAVVELPLLLLRN